MTNRLVRPVLPDVLVAAWDELRVQEPRMRIREAAAALGVSEAELVATRCGAGVVRLAGDWPEVLKRLEAAGTLKVITRNDAAVIECDGTYAPLSTTGPVGLVLGEEIDLRLFFRQWATAFAVIDPASLGQRLPSLQFFDSAGDAVHKVHWVSEDKTAELAAIAEAFRSENQSRAHDVSVTVRTQSAAVPPIDRTAFLDSWRTLRDTHDFAKLLRDHTLSRARALELGEPEFTRRLPLESYAAVVEEAKAREIPIMVFVGNRGGVQIYTGPVKNVVRKDGWFNILEKRFNLHLVESLVKSAWVVRKPTVDGVVTSVELVGESGEEIVQFFGKRKPGNPELSAWRGLVEEFAARTPVAA